MKELLDRISSYNLFNYFFPGIAFAILSEVTTGFSFRSGNLLIDVFSYYLIGLIISRFGSLVIEPLLRRIGLIKFAPYSDFVKASARDAKLETLSEVNNMYRTLCSMSVLLPLLILYKVLEKKIHGLSFIRAWVLIIALIVCFLLSYAKQTRYVANRVRTVISKQKQAKSVQSDGEV
jgi:hypothetical protein